MADRIPPHNSEAERSAIGAILLRAGDALPDVMEYVNGDSFYDPNHKEIFEAIKHLYDKGRVIDSITLCNELKSRGTLKTVGGAGYVSGLAAEVPSTSNAGEYAKIINEKAILRSLINVSNDVITQSYDGKQDTLKILDDAEKAIFEIGQGNQKKDFSYIGEVLIENIHNIDEAANAEGIVGLETGFKRLDEMTGGLQKSTLNIVAARPGMGKTALALNIAKYAAGRKKKSVLIFSLEMSKEELGSRILSMEASVESQKIKTGDVDENDWDRLNKAIDDLSDAKLAIDETAAISIMEMKNKCRRMKSTNGLDLVIVDYLQLMEGEGENRQQEVSKLSRSLKLMAKEMDCPFIVLSQLSRGPEQRTDKRPLLSDLRESGSIEQDADIVIFLYNDQYYNGDESEKPGITELNIAKHRSGPVGTIDLAWVGRYTKFSDIG
ncbi:MAG: replicative DNA helicase [Peptostreptococcaceae bacterium]|nr:replicative DNA helicase [Peptostreptococcaceae bacterium]MDY5739419.1 replicative DNA helicase [Anaerovoracaceae bacterium]